MNFNGGKSPMYIFGVDIDKLYEEIKLYKNLPEFCQNLIQKPEKQNRSQIIKTYNEITYENDIINKILEKPYKKAEIDKIVERLSKSQKKKVKNKLKLDLFFKNNNLSDILPSVSSFSTKGTSENKKIVIKKLKRKRPFRNSFNFCSQEKKDFDSSYFNNLSSSKITNEKMTIKNNNINEYTKKWDLPRIIKFDKSIGREKEKPKNPHKFKYMDVAKKIYTPNFDYVYPSDSNKYLSYSPDYKHNFNKVKSNITRKNICSSEKMRNSSSQGLYLIDAINNEKKKNMEIRNQKIREKYGKLFEFMNYDKKIHKLKISLIDKNFND